MSEVSVVQDDVALGAAPTRSWLRPGPTTTVWLLTALMAAVALVAGTSPGGLDFSVDSAPPVAWWAVVPLFAVAEVLVIHLPSLRSSHSHTLREIPAIVGLVFLAPGEYVLAYVAGTALALVFWIRLSGLKLFFNLAMFSLEAVIGAYVYHGVLDAAPVTSYHGWNAAMLAVIATDLVSAAAVTAAMSITDGRYDGQVLRESLRTGIPAAVVNACMALLVVVLIVREPSALPLVAVIVVILVLGYRRYISVATGYKRMALLFDFIGTSGRETQLATVVRTMLAEAVRIMRAERAELVLVPSAGDLGERMELVDGEVHRSTFSVATSQDSWWSPVLRGESVLRSPRTARSAGPREGIAVPLAVTDRVDAVLVVTDRTFEEETFTTEDLRLLETLAGHAAVTLDKARLVDRLQRLAEERRHEARHDPLTELPNRLAFREAVAEALRAGGGGAVLLLDLDDFKDVNDILGHDAGDTLLTVTARRLVAECDGFVARLGGDEFAVLLPGADADAAGRAARRLASVVAAPIALSDVNLTTSASIGISVFAGAAPAHPTAVAEPADDIPLPTSDEVLAQADVAMDTAKTHRSGVELHRPADTTSIRRRLELAAALPGALRSGDVQAWFQPQVATRTGAVVGAEALLRWTHPEHGPVPPPEVVALAARTGLLVDLTRTMFEQALRQRAHWARDGFELEVSVNVTPSDLVDGSLVSTVRCLLEETATPAAALTVEITESDVMTDPERCLLVLEELARLGVTISVDDFGIGHSSLAYLDRLPVHELKVDRSFVQRIEQRASDSTVMRATVALAHDLGLRVVAEGVENGVGLERVSALGCDRVQGYGLGRPMTAEAMCAWLVSDHVRRGTPA
jgi:diguanylate cyclase (GGDEF)-like protein